jgi:sarcosine oxidase/L-pipecolate oxidase
MVAKNSPVIIVGGGAWGLSTNITVYERAAQIPSPYSAAWDINKIVRAEYEDPFYTKLALVSITSQEDLHSR